MKPAQSLELPEDMPTAWWLSYRPTPMEASVTNVLRGAAAALIVTVALPAGAQWLTRPTPNIPRTTDGRPDLAAPAPRGADGHPDLSGHWLGISTAFVVPDDVLTAPSRALLREREETY